MITAEQLADRINGVGGSDIPVIAGLLEKYGKTREQLLLVKAGKAEPEPIPEEKVYWGEQSEPIIIKRLKSVKGWSIKKSDTLYHPDYHYLRCNPDGLIRKHEGRKGMGMLEVKNSRFIGKDGPADYQIAQLIWNIGIAGLSWGALAVLVGGCELQVFEYEHDEELYSNLVKLAMDFWAEVQTLKEAA
jgi:predicted phage-related endonuclease